MRAAEIRALLHAVDATRAGELDCDAFLTQLPLLVEARARGIAGSGDFIAAEAHERLCANCREETAALADILSGIDPSV